MQYNYRGWKVARQNNQYVAERDDNQLSAADIVEIQQKIDEANHQAKCLKALSAVPASQAQAQPEEPEQAAGFLVEIRNLKGEVIVQSTSIAAITNYIRRREAAPATLLLSARRVKVTFNDGAWSLVSFETLVEAEDWVNTRINARKSQFFFE